MPGSGRIALVQNKAAIRRRGGPASQAPRPTARSGTGAHRVACVVSDGLSILEFGVACDVFGTGPPPASVPPSPWYRLQVCSLRPGPVRVDQGFSIEVRHGIGVLAGADTVVVPPTERPDAVDPAVLEAIARAHARGARLVALCTGAFVLAAAGVLDGRRAATHWMDAEALRRRFPHVAVDDEVLYVDDGDVLTSAGATASIDLCLHIVRLDWGSDVANAVARQLVAQPHRDGGQAQFIETPMAPLAGDDGVGAALEWAASRLGEQISVAAWARQASMSPRTFARQFAIRTGTTPHRWLTARRVLWAQRLLETSEVSLDVLASRVGLGSGVNLRKQFQERLRTTPGAYRRAFRSAAPARSGDRPDPGADAAP